jgi:hypothetical protein
MGIASLNPSYNATNGRHCEERSDEAIHLSHCCAMDCFAQPVVGRRSAPTRWLAMTV